MKFYTIGVYNSTENEFFIKLIQNKIDTFCDIRQHRGLRGAKYAFVNSNKLQLKLEEFGIKYIYIKGLAPTDEIRAIQKTSDEKYGIKQRKREILDPGFVEEYSSMILSGFDFKEFFDSLIKINSKKIALFCVEENHEACHRSIVADTLAKKFNYKISHL
ncbi:MAG: hypothetical protein C5B52_09130 [Bacteroidetes bacterium]|nr:MAG: hypothetical protein C5B52_09130 [Bacteroidota bacterium]